MDWLGWMWNDLPTRVAVVGLVVYAAVMLALVWWTSHHYVRSAATRWRWTTWDKAGEAERTNALEERAPETPGEVVDQVDWRQEVT